MRSRAAELLANDAAEDEVRAAIDDELKAEVAIAHRGVCAEATCARDNPAFEDALAAELGAFLRLTGGGWSPEDKAEWISAATDELMEFPLSMLLPELAKARRREAWPNKLVPAIVEVLEPRLAKLRAEADTLCQLHALSIGASNVRDDKMPARPTR